MSEEITLAIIGIIGGLIAFLQKVLYGQGKSLYDIIVKLIDRFNISDNRLEDIADKLAEAADHRHEKLVDEINNLTDEMNFIKGKMSK